MPEQLTGSHKPHCRAPVAPDFCRRPTRKIFTQYPQFSDIKSRPFSFPLQMCRWPAGQWIHAVRTVQWQPSSGEEPAKLLELLGMENIIYLPREELPAMGLAPTAPLKPVLTYPTQGKEYSNFINHSCGRNTKLFLTFYDKSNASCKTIRYHNLPFILPSEGTAIPYKSWRSPGVLCFLLSNAALC